MAAIYASSTSYYSVAAYCLFVFAVAVYMDYQSGWRLVSTLHFLGGGGGGNIYFPNDPEETSQSRLALTQLMH